MKFRRRRSLVPRVNWREALEHTEPLRGQVWTRSERALRDPDVHWGWRVLAGGIAMLEIALLGWGWFGPALPVESTAITGPPHRTAGHGREAGGTAHARASSSCDGL